MRRFGILGVLVLALGGCGGEPQPSEVAPATPGTIVPDAAEPAAALGTGTMIIVLVSDVGPAFGRLSQFVRDAGGERLVARSDGPRMVVSFEAPGTAFEPLVAYLDEVGDVVRVAGELGGTHARRITVLLTPPDAG